MVNERRDCGLIGTVTSDTSIMHKACGCTLTLNISNAVSSRADKENMVELTQRIDVASSQMIELATLANIFAPPSTTHIMYDAVNTIVHADSKQRRMSLW